MKYLTPFNLAMALNVLSLLTLGHVVWRLRGLGKGAFAPKSPEERAGRILWALTVFKFISGNSKVWILAFIGSTAAVKWGDMGGFEQFSIILAASAQSLTHAEAFFDQTAARLAAGKPPIGTNGSGHTQVFTNPDKPATVQPEQPKT